MLQDNYAYAVIVTKILWISSYETEAKENIKVMDGGIDERSQTDRDASNVVA